METMNDDISISEESDEQETPVCIKCFRPINPLANYCSNCGGATGNFTHYLPVINIPWQASVWGQAWRQIGYPDVSLPGRMLRLIMVVWQAPILLLGLLFRSREPIVALPEEGLEPESASNKE